MLIRDTIWCFLVQKIIFLDCLFYKKMYVPIIHGIMDMTVSFDWLIINQIFEKAWGRQLCSERLFGSVW